MSIEQNLPSMQIVPPLLSKYRALLERGNTPFEYEERGVQKVRRLWIYLTRQEHLASHFIRFIFARNSVAVRLVFRIFLLPFILYI